MSPTAQAPSASVGGSESWWSSEHAYGELGQRLARLQGIPVSRTAVDQGEIRTHFEKIWDLDPLGPFLPSEFGGSDGDTTAVLALLDQAAFSNLPMALAIALTGALFILPISTHGEPGIARSVLSRFTDGTVCLGGMMMTEPGCGTDLFAAETQVQRADSTLRLQGVKHWSGLTGHADYWLVFARDDAAPRAGRLGYYVVDARREPGAFRVMEYYDAFGLEPIPYGRTRVDAAIREEQRLGCDQPFTSVVSGILCSSRITFAGMAHGFIRRMLSAATHHARARTVFGAPLASLDQVQARLEDIRLAEVATRVLCLRAAEVFPTLTAERSPQAWESTVIKALATEMMVSAASHLAVLQGAEGYRSPYSGFAAVAHAHPFQIFEGPNDVLFEQVARQRARAAGSNDLVELLQDAGFEAGVEIPWSLGSGQLTLDSQRRFVAAGRMLSLALVRRWGAELLPDLDRRSREALGVGSTRRIRSLLGAVME